MPDGPKRDWLCQFKFLFVHPLPDWQAVFSRELLRRGGIAARVGVPRPLYFLSENEEFLERAKDDAEIGPGLFTGGSRVVMNADLADGVSQSLGPGENFRVDQRAFGLHLDLLKKTTRVEFERAVDVAEPKPKYEVHQRAPSEGIDLADEGVLAIEPIPADDVISFQKGKEAVDLLEVELPVAVGIEDPLFGRLAEAALQRSAVTLVGFVVYGADLAMFCGQAVGNLAGSITAAVVDDDDLEIAADPTAGPQCGQRRLFHIGFFVVAGEEDTQGWKRFRRRIVQRYAPCDSRVIPIDARWTHVRTGKVNPI